MNNFPWNVKLRFYTTQDLVNETQDCTESRVWKDLEGCDEHRGIWTDRLTRNFKLASNDTLLSDKFNVSSMVGTSPQFDIVSSEGFDISFNIGEGPLFGTIMYF